MLWSNYFSILTQNAKNHAVHKRYFTSIIAVLKSTGNGTVKATEQIQ